MSKWAERGYTFIELLVVSAIVMLLASAVMPLARVTATRSREAELRRALREVRTAIDRYKDAADAQQIASLEIKVGSEGYPADLQVLVDGVAVQNDATGRKLKFLRRIPIDPMTGKKDTWQLRSSYQTADSTSWDDVNVFDVRSGSDEEALNGEKYSDW